MNATPIIFLADDDPGLRIGLDRALSGQGYAVRSVPDGAELLLLLADELPDLLVLDVMMPVVGGLEVLRRMQGDPRLRGVPVIVVTAMPTAATEAEAVRGGAVAFLPKPFRLDQLFQRIEDTLDARRADPRR
jgi:CheY-like chemotaxis protein